jgi:lysozyme
MKPRMLLALAAVAVLVAIMLKRSATGEDLMPIADDVDAQAARANRAAFLASIRWAEGTDDANGYRAIYGSTKARPRLFGSFAMHPVQSGEWAGDRLSDAMCAGAGLGPGCVTTAAGAYQMIYPTWTRMAQSLGLTDFAPASQDLAALWLINEAGALQDVDAGNFASAVDKVRTIWASLPGAGYDQPERSMSDLQTAYLHAGGTIA